MGFREAGGGRRAEPPPAPPPGGVWARGRAWAGGSCCRALRQGVQVEARAECCQPCRRARHSLRWTSQTWRRGPARLAARACRVRRRYRTGRPSLIQESRRPGRRGPTQYCRRRDPAWPTARCMRHQACSKLRALLLGEQRHTRSMSVW